MGGVNTRLGELRLPRRVWWIGLGIEVFVRAVKLGRGIAIALVQS